MVSVPRRGHEGQKNRIKVPRLVNAAMSGLPAEIFLAINVVVFVGAGYYLPSFTWARSVTASLYTVTTG
jgi:hypothetical protein